VFESVNNGLHIVIDNVNATGQKTKLEYTVYFDGKEYPVTRTLDGQPTESSAVKMSAKKSDDYTIEITQTTTNGKFMGTTKLVFATDGKLHVATQTGTTSQGQSVKNVVLVEKQ
jgi:hypothetical protein